MVSEKWFPLEGKELVAHWGFEFDVPEQSIPGAKVAGDIILRSDGKLLRRYSRYTYDGKVTTYKYGPWGQMSRSNDQGPDPDKVMASLKDQGFRLHPPRLPIHEHEVGPVEGAPDQPEFL
jgi:hypothetical protein